MTNHGCAPHFLMRIGFDLRFWITNLLAIGTITLSTICFAEGALSVAAVMRGPQAPEMLATALEVLAKNHSDIIFKPTRKVSEVSSIEKICGHQKDNSNLRSCTFWDAAIAAGVWPADAPLLERVAKTFASGGDYLLPQVSVTIETSAITATIPLSRTELSQDDQRTLCRRQRWSNNDDDLNCVIEVIPSFGLRAEQSKLRRVIIRQRVIRLVVPNIASTDTESVRATLRKGFSETSVTAGSRAAVEEEAEGRPLSQSVATSPCAEAELQQASTAARTLINWPNGMENGVIKKRTVAVVEHDSNLFPPRRTWVLSNDIVSPRWPSAAISAVNHPIFTVSGDKRWEIGCSSVMQALPEGPLAHTIAVASILLGNPARLSVTSATPIDISPFFAPSVLQIDSLNAILPAGNLMANDGQEQVIVASLQTAPPLPSEKPLKFRPYKVKDYQAATHLLNATGKILIAAAPIVVNDAPLDEDPDPTDNFSCLSWPACLDSLGTTLTVAAINNNHELMLTEPGTGKLYEITQRTVSVAAPGEQLPVAAIGPGGPTFALASGTSVAAPVVAAIALKMREHFSQPSESYDIIAAIEATADLSRNFDQKIRFGIVNAARAFSVASLPSRAAIVFKNTNDEQADANGPSSKIKEIVGISPPETCRVSENQTQRGVLLFYRSDDPKVNAKGYSDSPQCIAISQLLRIRETAVKDGRRQYTIVFNDIKSYVDNPFPQIVRDVFLEPYSAKSSLCMIALGIPDTDSETQPCLTGVDETGERIGLNLISIDIAFQPSGWRGD